jgi:Integrase core domain/Transposase
MIGALKQMEAGRTAADVGRELGVSKHTIYAWKAKCGGMSVSEAQRLRQLEDENRRLKKLVADLSLDKEMLKAVIEKKRVELVDRREEARWLWEHYLVSQRRVCGLLVLAEFTSRHFLAWCLERRIEVVHIEPGKPVQNAHMESFHGKLRDECLNASWFQNLWDARRKITAWRTEYNEERPYSSLGYRTPAAFAAEIGGGEGCGKDGGFAPLENAARFPLSHSPGDGGPSLSGEILKQENRLGSEANVV